MIDEERRTHYRRDAALPIVLQVELHGFDSVEGRFEARGKTVNLSRGGLLARLDQPLDAGLRCVAHFPNAMGLLGRTMIYGTVRRARSAVSGHEVAVIFDTPLQEIELALVGGSPCEDDR